jgi:hypothetical protein
VSDDRELVSEAKRGNPKVVEANANALENAATATGQTEVSLLVVQLKPASRNGSVRKLTSPAQIYGEALHHRSLGINWADRSSSAPLLLEFHWIWRRLRRVDEHHLDGQVLARLGAILFEHTLVLHQFVERAVLVPYCRNARPLPFVGHVAICAQRR